VKVSQAHNELWHYTTTDGLVGIIETKQLWATRCDYLNDTEEFVGFFDEVLPLVFKRVLSKHKQLDHAELDELRRICRSALDRGYWKFVASFASVDIEDPDREWVAQNGRLSQWRGYGAGGGYALILDTAKLEGLMAREGSLYLDTHFSLADAEYGMHSLDSISHPENQKRTEELIAELPELYSKLQIGTKSELEDAADRLFSELLLPLAVVRKNRAFREEREVRLVVTLPNPHKQEEVDCTSDHLKPTVHHSNRRGTPVPSVHLFEGLKLTSLPVKRVVIGPHRDKLSRQAAVRSLLDANGFRDTEITVSKIPFVE
jgi:hypothetical protein